MEEPGLVSVACCAPQADSATVAATAAREIVSILFMGDSKPDIAQIFQYESITNSLRPGWVIW